MVKISDYLTEYITHYYLTLMLLSGLVIILISNRRNKIERAKYFWIYAGLVLAMSLFENLEIWCDAYDKPVWILYIKSAVCYSVQPFLILLQLYLIAPIRHKLLLSMPFIVDAAVIFADLFGLNNIYGYNEGHHIIFGKYHVLPVLVLCFYLILLMYYSLGFIHQKEYAKGIIAVFVSFSAIAATLLEYRDIITGHSTEISVIEILIYYFYLAAVSYSANQKELYESRIELERQRNKLLVMQMQPHFIFNALATIQSLCYTDSEAAADCIAVFGDYLRANIDSISADEMIEFKSELKHIKEYVKLEKASTDVHIDVVYELGVTDFKIPPLTLQPIVENAIKHGALTRRDGTGFVKIATEAADEVIRITVTDNGTGASLTDKQKEHKSVGTENVRQRLALQCGGTLDINITENGAVSTMIIPVHSGDMGGDADVHDRRRRQKVDRRNARKNARKH